MKKKKISGRKLSSPTYLEILDDLVNDNDSMRDYGIPLDSSTLEFMGSRFGFDFSNVHTGERASESNRALSDLAYTLGNDIVFGEGKYAPNTTEGQKLLAHELTHVIQQSSQLSQRIYNIYRQDDGGVSTDGGPTDAEVPAGVSTDRGVSAGGGVQPPSEACPSDW